ncbi:MAG: BrnT family toxin [Selenomonadaceae bacterium]|nr:BrnT family toxin [Selenomonadaceae bacterium]MBR0260586.1 BrnT family toxin [Selenomonadaceae bacterium]
MKTSIDGRLFEWDDAKNKINKIKHGINFKTAARVFSDPYLFIEEDSSHSIDEDRWKAIGMVDDILLVIYTERGESTRLISARKAGDEDRRKYYGDRILFFTESPAAFDGGGEG